jgi:hypothetical protein
LGEQIVSNGESRAKQFPAPGGAILGQRVSCGENVVGLSDKIPKHRELPFV